MNRPALPLMLALALSAALPAAASPADAAGVRSDLQERVGAFLQTHGTAKAHWRSDLLGPSLLVGLHAEAAGKTSRAKAESWVAANAELFGLNAADLQVASESHYAGRTSVTFQQMHEGAPVHQRSLVLVVDDQRGLITRAVNGTFPVLQLRSRQSVDARGVALSRFGQKARAAENEHIKRVVVASHLGAFEAALVHVAPDPTRLEVVEVIVDLNRGEVAGLRSLVQH